MLEATIENLLGNDTVIESIVGEKICPLLADESVREPYIVYQVIAENRDYTLSSTSNLASATVQISCWANHYYDVIILKNAVLDCLDNYSDKDNPSGAGETFIEIIHLDGIGDLIDYEPNVDNKKFGKRIIFTVFFRLN